MKNLKGKRMLVTGGTGFIGSNLVKELIKNHADVYAIDIKILPQSIFVLDGLSKKVKLEIIDIRHRNKVCDFLKKFKIEYIFHFAAVASVSNSYESPSRTLETNIMGTINILEGIRESNYTKGVIVASSDKAYGKTNKAYTEESSLKGDEPFGVSKSSADLICQAYHKTYKMPVVITRFSNVYGEGDLHFERLIPEICKTIIRNEVFKIRSDGTYMRDYIYIKDVVRGYMTLLNNIENIQGEAYNFSSPDNLSVLEVIKKANKLIGKNLSYKIVNNSKNEIPYQHLDDKKIRQLGWKCQYTLDKVLPEVFAWYKKILS